MSDRVYFFAPSKQPSELYDMHKKQIGSFWTVDEVDLSVDVLHWKNNLKEEERKFILKALAFFAASDGIVIHSLAARCIQARDRPKNLPPVCDLFWSMQMGVEAIHSETYGFTLETLESDPAEQDRLFNSIETVPVIGRKAQWALKYIENENVDFKTLLVAFAIVEGLFFSGSFCAIYWLKSRGLMPGLAFSNELISRDESLHQDFAVTTYLMCYDVRSIANQVLVYQMLLEAVSIEKEFVTDALPVNLLGINRDTMCQYIEFTALRLGRLLGLKEDIFPNVTNPFPFMTMMNLPNSSNFFEKRVSEYSKRAVAATTSSKMFEINENEDF